MPQITLELTDTEARAIAALEAIDGRTVDQRLAPTSTCGHRSDS